MITLTIQLEFLFQIHKNHLKQGVTDDYVLRFRGTVNKIVIDITSYTLTEYHNFYLFNINTLDFKKLDSSSVLEIISPANEVVYTSSINRK